MILKIKNFLAYVEIFFHNRSSLHNGPIKEIISKILLFMHN
jgi:hypothetical protein